MVDNSVPEDPQYIQPYRATASEPQPSAAVAEPVPQPRRKRKGLRWLIALLVVAVIVVVGLFVGEHFARVYADNYVRERITETLTVADPDAIGVDLGDGSIIVQAIAGTIDNARVTVPKVTVGDLTGNAVATATAIPLDSTKPVGSLKIGFSVPEKNLSGLTKTLGGDVQLDITLKDGTVQIASDLKVLSAVIPIAVGLEPSAKDGNLVFVPKSFDINGQSITADALQASPFGNITERFLQDQSVCVASYLPKALVLDKVTVTDSALSIVLDGDGAVLGSDDLSTKGTCP